MYDPFHTFAGPSMPSHMNKSEYDLRGVTTISSNKKAPGNKRRITKRHKKEGLSILMRVIGFSLKLHPRSLHRKKNLVFSKEFLHNIWNPGTERFPGTALLETLMRDQAGQQK